MSYPSWQESYKNLITSPRELLAQLELPKDLSVLDESAQKAFPLKLSQEYANRIKKGTLEDPLLKQVLPHLYESYDSAGFSADPLEEQSFVKSTGVLQKYQHRALLVLTSACAIHCRYCFRRHFPYKDHRFSKKHIEDLLDPIQKDASIEEIILSGGDPLSVSDSLLEHLIASLNQMPQVTRLRIHTRLPMLIPSRITDGLLNALGSARAKVVVVLHINHAQEIDDEVQVACHKLAANSIMLLNQSVLLKGINNDAQTLAELSKRLFQMNVLPYYLHQLDKVAGAQHFEVPESDAKRILHDLMAKLPGYLVPKYVREVPGDAFKTPIPL